MSSGALRSAESISRAPEGVAVRALTWVVGAWVAVTCVAGPWTGSGAEGVAGADQPRAAESGTRGAERVADPTGTGREAVGQAGAVRSEGTSAMRGNGGGVAVRGAGTAGAGGPVRPCGRGARRGDDGVRRPNGRVQHRVAGHDSVWCPVVGHLVPVVRFELVAPG